jgi:hypothetical protein
MVKIPLDSILSLAEEFDYNLVKIYPNPVIDYVVFERKEENPVSPIIMICDAYGRKISSIYINKEQTVWDTRQVKAGVYFYSLIPGNARLGGKIIIIK